MSNDWIFRPSSNYPNEGLYFRYVQMKCGKHGMTEHTEIQTEKSRYNLPSTICRECCRDVERRRANQKHREEIPVKTQAPLFYNRFKND